MLFVTATVPHGLDHSLEEVRTALIESWRYLFSGEPWRRRAAANGFRGQVKAVEVTVGEWSGWHPHLHALIFLDREIDDEPLEELGTWWRERWEKKVRSWYLDGRGGGRTLRCRHLGRKIPREHTPAFGQPNPRHSLRVLRGTKAAGHYVAKMGLGRELTGIGIKEGRRGNVTPWQLLSAAAYDRCHQSQKLWVEYCGTMAKRRSLTWTPGLLAFLSGAPELEDQELLEISDPADPIVLRIDSRLWDRLTQPHHSKCLRNVAGDLSACHHDCKHGVDPPHLEEAVLYLLDVGLEPGGAYLRKVLLELIADVRGRVWSRGLTFDESSSMWSYDPDGGPRIIAEDDESLVLRALTPGESAQTETAKAA